MDNNRGIKSLQRDRKRIIILTKKQKKKLEEINEKNDEELKKLEKKSKAITNNNLYKDSTAYHSRSYFQINCQYYR